MTKAFEIYINPLFDYSEFLGPDEPLFTDCVVKVSSTNSNDQDSNVYKAHALILANSSQFFANAFSSDSREKETGEVNIVTRQDQFFKAVLHFMYNGKISFAEDEVMPLLNLATYLGISSLENQLKQYIYLRCNTSLENLLNFVNQCYSYDLIDELKYLLPYLSCRFDEIIATEKYSQRFDVGTFCTMLINQKNKTLLQIFEILGKFFNLTPEYQITEEDQNDCYELLKLFASKYNRMKEYGELIKKLKKSSKPVPFLPPLSS